MAYDAVVFDNDGVLTVPTRQEVIVAAIETALQEFGIANPDPEHIRRMVSIQPDALERLCARYDLDPTEFWPERDRHVSTAHQREIQNGRKPLYDDVQHLHELTVPLGIVSNNQHSTIEYLVDYFDLSEVFSTYYGRDLSFEGLKRKKPNPYYLKRAVADLEAEKPLFVGDSRTDIEVAARLDIDSAFIRRPHRRTYTGSPEPTHEIDSFEQLQGFIDT